MMAARYVTCGGCKKRVPLDRAALHSHEIKSGAIRGGFEPWTHLPCCICGELINATLEDKTRTAHMCIVCDLPMHTMGGCRYVAPGAVEEEGYGSKGFCKFCGEGKSDGEDDEAAAQQPAPDIHRQGGDHVAGAAGAAGAAAAHEERPAAGAAAGAAAAHTPPLRLRRPRALLLLLSRPFFLLLLLLPLLNSWTLS